MINSDPFSVMAIDPGGAGSIAVVNFSSERPCVMEIQKMPEAHHVAAAIYVAAQKHKVSTAIIEKQTGCAGYAVSAPAMFKFGMFYGAALSGMFAVSRSINPIRACYVYPTVWQKSLGVGKSGAKRAPKGASQEEKNRVRDENASVRQNWKRVLADEAERRFPGIRVTLANADALLMASFAFEFLTNDNAYQKFRDPA